MTTTHGKFYKYWKPIQARIHATLQRFSIVKIVEDEKSEASKPFNLQLGYFADISERDIRLYAQSLAKSSHASLESDISYFGVVPFLNGYAYEIHEGGPGKALLPSILKHYAENGEHATPDDPLQVFVESAERIISVEVHSGGLTAYVLPDLMKPKAPVPTPGIKGTVSLEKMSLNNTHRLYQSSKVVAAAGLLFLLLAIVFRPSLPPAPTGAPLKSFASLPVAQWKVWEAAGPNSTLKYAGEKWSASSAVEKKEGAK